MEEKRPKLVFSILPFIVPSPEEWGLAQFGWVNIPIAERDAITDCIDAMELQMMGIEP